MSMGQKISGARAQENLKKKGERERELFLKRIVRLILERVNSVINSI